MKAVLFDMDGTLVPMDAEKFTKAYFKALCVRLAPHGYEPKELVDSIWRGTAAMVKNDGAASNSDVFWRVLRGIYGERIMNDMSLFDEFYANDFGALKSEVSFAAEAAATVKRLNDKGVKLVLASNPVFPALAQTTRIGWAGIDSAVFSHITSYENSHYCKPNPEYYTEIIEGLGVKPEECLMVGNDVREDGAAAKAGLCVFILTDCLINPDNADITAYPHGGFKELNAYLDGVGL